MHIAIITAGGAGMFCGSCMHDNTWARALQAQGAEVTLIPTYTPLKVDEQNMSNSPIFFGGINIYLQYRWRWWRSLPRTVTRWLDSPWAINLATRWSVSNNAHDLGALTLAMLAGEDGPEQQAIDELVQYCAEQLRPDVICFSNALLVGTLRNLKQCFDGPVFCTLQGDDIFLEELLEPHRSSALEMIQERAAHFDGYLVHSQYYRDFMSEYLGLPVEKFHQIPLGIDLDGHDGQPVERNSDGWTVGYFARICPEKGLHRLVEAFRLLHRRHPQTRLRVGGYLGKRDRKYFREISRQAKDLGDAFQYIGSPQTRGEKVAFFKELDVLSVPTVYQEPKGLYVLEALANGVPVVQPNHGAFGELLETTGGGLLVPPGDPVELAAALEELLLDPKRRIELARTGRSNVRQFYDLEAMAVRTVDILQQALDLPRPLMTERVT